MSDMTISRITDTAMERELETPSLEDFIRYAVEEGADISDDPDGVVGWFGGQLYPGGLLIFTFQKHGQTFAGPGEHQPEVDRADSAAAFLSVGAVVEIVHAAVSERTAGVMKPVDEEWAAEYVVRTIEEMD